MKSEETELTELGTEIESAMLLAITSDYSMLNTPIDTLKLSEQKQYLIKNIDAVNEHDRRQVCNVLVMGGGINLLNWNAEGTIINLDSVQPSYLVSQMYELLFHKIHNNK